MPTRDELVQRIRDLMDRALIDNDRLLLWGSWENQPFQPVIRWTPITLELPDPDLEMDVDL